MTKSNKSIGAGSMVFNKIKRKKRNVNIIPILETSGHNLEIPPTKTDIWQKCETPKIDFKSVRKWYTLGLFKHKSKEQILFETKKDAVVLVKMEMNNGRFREFLAVEKFGSFVFNNKEYVIDLQQKYYIIERDLWAYDFHESISLPIRNKIKLTEETEKLLTSIETASRKPKNPHVPTDEIKTLIENSRLVDVEASLNPTSLKRFTDAELAKQIMQGAMLGKIFKIMFVLIVIISILMLLNLIISMYSSGIFEKLKNMF